MDNNKRAHMDFEPNINISNVSFDGVSKEFENEFKKYYKNSLEMMSDSESGLTNAAAANTLGVLEKMAQRISDYSKNSDFEASYNEILRESEPFTET